METPKVISRVLRENAKTKARTFSKEFITLFIEFEFIGWPKSKRTNLQRHPGSILAGNRKVKAEKQVRKGHFITVFIRWDMMQFEFENCRNCMNVATDILKSAVSAGFHHPATGKNFFFLNYGIVEILLKTFNLFISSKKNGLYKANLLGESVINLLNNVNKVQIMGLLPALSQRTVKSTCQLASRSLLSVYFNESIIASFGTTSKDVEDKKEKHGQLKLPEEPQNCCMSGCANCVWVAYAEELAKILNDGGETAKMKVMEHVKDPNLRAFLMLELQHIFKKDK